MSQIGKTLLHVAIISGLTFLVFAPCLQNDFINFDDHRLITSNPMVVNNGPFHLSDYLHYGLKTPHYKPLTYISWNLEFRLSGLNPRLFHLNNLLLHSINGILVYFLVILLPFPIFLRRSLFAVCCSLFFSLHPIHVESVAWASERKDLLCAFFFLTSLLAYQFYLKNSKKRALLLSALSYLLVLGSKSMGITLVAVLFLLDWLYRRPLKKEIIMEKLPHILIFLLGLWMYGLFDKPAVHTAGLTAGFINDGFRDYPDYLDHLSPGHIRILIISTRIVVWLWHILFPTSLSPVYPQEAILKHAGYWIHLFPVMLLTILFLYFLFRKHFAIRFSLFAFRFFLLTLLPALAISDRGLGVFVPDRYTYLPVLGIIIGAVGIIHSISKLRYSKPAIYIIMTVTIVAFGHLSHTYCNVWRTSETLWTRVIEQYPEEASGWNGRGKHYKDLGMGDRAMADFNRAVQVNPKFYWAYYNRAQILMDSGQLDKALKDYLLLTRVDRWFPEGFINLGAVYGRQGQYELALQALNRACQLRPSDPVTLLNRGLTHLHLRKYDESIHDFVKYLELRPGNADVINAIGVCYWKMGKTTDAEAWFRKALRIKPDFEVCRKNLDNLYKETTRSARIVEK